MNNLKFKAFRQTLGFFAIVAIASTVFMYLTSFVGAEIMAWFTIACLAAGGFYLIYSVNLSRLALKDTFDTDAKQ